MKEFSNRIEAQREILHLVNAECAPVEELYGLSRKAITRWALANRMSQGSKIVRLVEELAGDLFFLANKSQQQISDDQVSASLKINVAIASLAAEIHGAYRGLD